MTILFVDDLLMIAPCWAPKSIITVFLISSILYRPTLGAKLYFYNRSLLSPAYISSMINSSMLLLIGSSRVPELLLSGHIQSKNL
jgi:hypothetical protein